MNSEEKYNEIREKLLSLPRLKAKENFRTELLHRINLTGNEDSAPVTNKKVFSLFGKNSGWAVPAVSFAVIAILFVSVYLIFFQSNLDKTSLTSTSSLNDSIKGNITQKDTMPGREIANDLEIGKNNELNDASQPLKGYNETDIQSNTPDNQNPGILNNTNQTGKSDNIQKNNNNKFEEKPSIDSKSNKNREEIPESPALPNNKINYMPSPKDVIKQDENKGIAPVIKGNDNEKSSEEGKNKSDNIIRADSPDNKTKLTKDLTKETLENLKKNINDKVIAPIKEKDKEKEKKKEDKPVDIPKDVIKKNNNPGDTTKKNNNPGNKNNNSKNNNNTNKNTQKEKPKQDPPVKKDNKESNKNK